MCNVLKGMDTMNPSMQSLEWGENMDNLHIILEKSDIIYNWPDKTWLRGEGFVGETKIWAGSWRTV